MYDVHHVWQSNHTAPCLHLRCTIDEFISTTCYCEKKTTYYTPYLQKIMHPLLLTLTKFHAQTLNLLDPMTSQHCDFFNNRSSTKPWKWCTPNCEALPKQTWCRGQASERESPPSLVIFYYTPKDIQNWHKKPMGSETTKDQRFCGFFGCKAAVVVNVRGSICPVWPPCTTRTNIQLLCSLFFLKCYPTETQACTATCGHKGSIDPKMLRKFIWPFIKAKVSLEPFVVCAQKYCLIFIIF